MIKATVLELKPDIEQRKLLNAWFGASRKVWNLGVAIADKHFEQYNSYVGKDFLSNHLICIKETIPYLKDVNAQALQFVSRNLNTSYERFFDSLKNPKENGKVGKPKFHSYKKHNSFQLPGNVISKEGKPLVSNSMKFDIENGLISFAKFEINSQQSWIKVDYKNLPFDIKTDQDLLRCLTVSTIKKLPSGKIEISITFDNEAEYPTPVLGWATIEKALGVDSGLRTFANYSDNTKINKPDFFEVQDKRLVRLQQSMDRKYKARLLEIIQPFTKSTRRFEQRLQSRKQTPIGVVYRIKQEIQPVKKVGKSESPKVVKLLNEVVVESAALNITKRSNNYEKTRVRLNKSYEKVYNQTEDFLNKLVLNIVRRTEKFICIESLAIQEMMKNPDYAKSIARACWGRFFDKLEKKIQEVGKILLRLGRWEPSSKTCHECGYYHKNLDPNCKTWTCPGCKREFDRDYNASLNIRDWCVEEYNKWLEKMFSNLLCSEYQNKELSKMIDDSLKRTNKSIENISKKLDKKGSKKILEFVKSLKISCVYAISSQSEHIQKTSEAPLAQAERIVVDDHDSKPKSKQTPFVLAEMKSNAS